MAIRSEGVIVSWGNFIRRSTTISQMTGYKNFHVAHKFKKSFLKPINYIRAFILTIKFLEKYKNNETVIVLTLPPNYLLLLYAVSKNRKKKKFIADCHNGCYSKKWTKVTPFMNYLLRKCDLVLVHNIDFYHTIKSKYEFLDINVVPDPPSIPTKKNIIIEKENYFVFPGSYSKDEPIEELIHALSTKSFRQLNAKIFFTGPTYKLSKFQISRLKQIKEIVITGFLSIDKYEDLLSRAIGVLCLTKFEGIQLCAINEAIGFNSVPIYSKTKTLDKMYKKCGIAVDLKLDNLNNVLLKCINSKDDLLKNCSLFNSEMQLLWKKRYLDLFKI